jgi:monoterpene epsilon-lactone hydrolase
LTEIYSGPVSKKVNSLKVFLFIHGGAWFLNAGLSGTTEAVLIAARMKIPVISIDYRRPPKYPAPAATDDVSAVWKELLKKTSPASVIMGGTSAGGNIAMSSVQRFKDLGLPVPGALYIGTPAVDVDMTGDSRFINEGIDRLLVTWKPLPQDAGAMYAGELGKKHPYVSPIYGDFTGFPPSYIIAGTRDLMLSDAVRAHRALRRVGVEAELHIYEGFSHGDYLVIWNAPESEEHFEELNRFALKNLSYPLPLKSDLPDDSEKLEIPKSTIY